jgi:hypothetical protein
VLVWQADTRSMNPAVDPQLIADAYAADDAAAAAEYGAEFRRDIESFVSREAIDAVVVAGCHELPPVAGRSYVAFVDPSGGSQDSMTLAVAHRAIVGTIVLDCVRERRPPFSPADVVDEFAALLRAYRVSTVTGDRYGGEWPRDAFRAVGIEYRPAEQSKSEYYGALLPLVNAGRVELLDLPRLITQLATLERRTARGGRDSIDHAPGGHDDVINAAAGALVTAAGMGSNRLVFSSIGWAAVPPIQTIPSVITNPDHPGYTGRPRRWGSHSARGTGWLPNRPAASDSTHRIDDPTGPRKLVIRWPRAS